MSSILSLGNYAQLIRISRDDRANKVDWVGCFGYLSDQLAEGYAFEVISVDGKSVMKPVRDGCCVRLYTDKIEYSKLGYIAWRRPKDSFTRTDESVLLPCIRIDRITEKHLFDDPEYRTVQRTIVTLRPVLATSDGCGSAIGLEYHDE
ncbi:MAG: hypothetical protein WAW13_02300 [Minisyncoccia bacterium]